MSASVGARLGASPDDVSGPNTRCLGIAYLLLPAAFGGLERVVRLLARGCASRGLRVVVGVLDLPGGAGREFAELGQADGVTVARIPVSGRGYLSERAEIRSWLRGLGPHILHTHGYRPDIVDAPVARRLGIATVSTFHGFCANSFRERLYEHLQVVAARRAHRVIAVSRSIETRLLESGVLAERLAFIPNAIPGDEPLTDRDPARLALGVPLDRPTIGWVGRLTPEKGLDIALRAHARLEPPRPLLTVVGGGPQERDLRDLAADLGIVTDVLWLGALPSVSRYFRAFDVIVLSSRTEGAPMVALEAAAAGTPLIATRVGEVERMLGEDAACLVDPERPDDLAGAFRAFFSSPGLAANRAIQARRRVTDSHAIGPWVDRHLELYAAAAQASPSSP